jgi:3'-phosphoadenosine 5'-phosphosulfate sulfotransferase (PAPS reductase)/FAD synthetase
MHCRKSNAFGAGGNRQLEKLSAEGRVAWALENLPGEYVLSSSFGIQAAVSLHLVNQIARIFRSS